MGTLSYETANDSEHQTERRFYERYGWCLNPLQPLEQLFARLGDELEWYPALDAEWQRQEARINLYLLTCAIHCTVSDYLGPRLVSFSKLASRWPRARLALSAAGKAALAADRLRSVLFDGAVLNWHEEWEGCVNLACRILLNELGAQSQQTAQLAAMSRELAGRELPRTLQRAPMQLVSGFRAQDLTHHDVIALADAFDLSHATHDGSLAIVGARTAGAYFAPLMNARLQQRGWNSSWIAVRPKAGLGHWEKKNLLAMTSPATQVLIVDDHPDTGETIRLMVDLLEECGIGREKITVAVPSHEAQSESGALTGGYTDVKLVTISPQDSHKHRMLASEQIRQLIEQMISSVRPGAVVIDDEDTNAINRRLEAHLSEDFQVHTKRVFALRAPGPSEKIHRVLAKSVGWGWLGYHAYLAGSRLHEFVPEVYGLRDGTLFSKWIEVQPYPAHSEGEIAERVAVYTAARVKLLSLAGDPAATQWSPSVGGSYTLTKVLRGVYPPYIRWMKMRALWKALQAYATPQPAFIDGNLAPEEWLADGKTLLKIDYEHHGFGNPAPNVVDAAYDLAFASLKLNLPPEAQRRLVEEYTELTDDQGAGERLVLHALSCGHLAAEWARFHALRARTVQACKQLEAEHIHACNFLTYTLAAFCAEQFAGGTPEALNTEWSKNLFFLDLDGVFDRSSFYFPHTTASGMAALAALRKHGYSVVLNTGRPAAHVRRYCSSYGLAAGIAEYGCLFVDHIAGREKVLIDAESREQLTGLRTRLMDQSGVFIDPTYEVAIRGYRLQNSRAVGLSETSVREALREFPQLTSISSPVDTYFFPVGAGKGSATQKVMDKTMAVRETSAAIGDTENDLPMLGCVARAYVPANANKEMRREALRLGHSLMRAPFQRGLLQAVQDLTDDRQGLQAGSPESERRDQIQRRHILKTMLEIGDRSVVQHLINALRRNQL